MNFDEIVNKVPNYTSFLTVDELDESTYALEKEFPDIVSVFQVGESRKGHPILCSKIGSGEKNALFFAFPHPNEPIGAMTIEFLSRELAENDKFREESGYTWYFIKCVDPDGTRLNEDWFKGPYNIYNYTRNFFRPGSIEQVEWTFPVDYKNLSFDRPMPETKAIMKVIEETKPAFMYSLHNAGFGGAYWYITHPYREIFDDLRAASEKQGIPLHLGEPESPAIKELDTSIFEMLGIEEEYDYLEKYTDVSPEEVIKCGTSSNSYANKFNDCVTFLTELPYFFDKRIQDLSDSNMTRREAILKNIEMNQAHYTKLDGYMEKIRAYISDDNPFPLLVEQMIDGMPSMSEAKKEWANQDEFHEIATVSEVFDNLTVAKFYNGLSIGLLARTVKFELDKLDETKKEHEEKIKHLREIEEKALQYLEENSNELEEEMDYEVISIQKLVKIQVECGLIVSHHRAKSD